MLAHSAAPWTAARGGRTTRPSSTPDIPSGLQYFATGLHPHRISQAYPPIYLELPSHTIVKPKMLSKPVRFIQSMSTIFHKLTTYMHTARKKNPQHAFLRRGSKAVGPMS